MTEMFALPPRLPMLLGDIGGTNARFAVLGLQGLGIVTTMPVAAFADLASVIEAYITKAGARVEGMALAIAGPVRGNRCVMTNSGWVIDAGALAERFAVKSVQLLNDFSALAWALGELRDADVYRLGGRSGTSGPRLVLGPGTGLGVSCFFPAGTGGNVLPSEGGHITLAGNDVREDAILAWIRTKWGHVSAERVLSGPGLLNLYEAATVLAGRTPQPHTPSAIVSAAREGSCPHCMTALDLFCALLGSFAGSAALMFSAEGGVYLAGGIVPKILDLLEASSFRTRFESKGRFRSYLEPVPVFAILRSDPAMVGLQAMLVQGGMHERPAC